MLTTRELAEMAMQVVPWGGDQRYFFDVNFRLMSKPETNFQHWDYIEKDEIETYLIRCKQLEGEKFLPSYFMENWKNLMKAHEFCEVLRQRFEPMPPDIDYPKKDLPVGVDPYYHPGQLKTRPLKQAIREGKVIEPWGTMFGNERIIETCKRCIADLDLCIKIKDETQPPVTLTVAEYKRKRAENTLFSLVLKEYNQTDRLDLVMGEEGSN